MPLCRSFLMYSQKKQTAIYAPAQRKSKLQNCALDWPFLGRDGGLFANQLFFFRFKNFSFCQLVNFSFMMLYLSFFPFLGGCSPVVKQPTPLVAGQTQEMTSPQELYKIQAGDLLDIKFYDNPELNEQLQVRPDGRISLQLVDEIVATGMTPVELKNTLLEKYKTEFKNPKITVIVRSFSLQKIYVSGEVKEPKVIDLQGNIRVLQAISQVGGFIGTAKKDEIVVIRRKIGSKPQIFQINIEMVVDGTDPDQDIVLCPQDIIYVPKSHIANVNQWVDQYMTKMSPLIWSLSLDYSVN